MVSETLKAVASYLTQGMSLLVWVITPPSFRSTPERIAQRLGFRKPPKP